ncbi:sporulation protein YunB [Paraliobacillus salinarum]|uniref:sporulation protein YunB n=1 Tax=Paraliobacillus salinarum TaxID=1158996 RepID=UPI001FE8D6B8|nr:sporulation protein YunB [Paraliobacillus salinarum]
MWKKTRIKRHRKPPAIRHLFFLTAILFVIMTLISLVIVNKGIKPVLLDIAETKNKQYANMAMGIAVNKKLNEDLQVEDLIEFQYGNDGQVVSYRINAAMENRVQRNIQYRVENFIHQLEQGVVPDTSAPLDVDIEQQERPNSETIQQKSNLIEIPLGQILNLPLLANLGPKIPVNLELVGYVSTEVETKVTGVKINSIHIEPTVHIEVEIRTIIPFGTKTAHIKQEIPIGSGGYNGEVPQFYNNNGNLEDPNLSIPIQPLQ